MPFAADALPARLADDLRRAGMVEGGQQKRSRVRASTVGDRLFLHSAFPTTEADAVFLGPDSYRFANFIADELGARPPAAGARIAEIGVGAGVGAVTAADCCPSAAITATDINPAALRLARVNAAAAGVGVETIRTSGLDGVAGPFDVVLLNPPFIVDADERAYRHGGTMHGGQLCLDLARGALPKLAPGGRLLLYTGSAIVDGADRLRDALAQAAAADGCAMRYREIDPDIFGEELDGPLYAEVERIALVTAVFTRPA